MTIEAFVALEEIVKNIDIFRTSLCRSDDEISRISLSIECKSALT